MRMIKIVLTAATTAILCFLIAAAMGPAARTRSDGVRIIIIPTGGYFKLPSLDLTCVVFSSDPTHIDPGPALFCNRASVSTLRGSASVAVSRYHITVFPSGRGGPATSVARTP
jgi:hypothetical protein